MIKALLAGLLAVTLSFGAVLAGPGTETYDLLFRQGTLDAIERDEALVYRREVTNALRPQSEERDTGLIALSMQAGGEGLAHLEFRQDEKHRALGRFPASVGNPMIMYFYESVIRDMAESAGGSPYYIRNRVKEALVQPADVEWGEAVVDGQTVKTQIVRMQPFAADPNQERMRGFGDLELVVTMSDEVPGWYVSLVAEAVAEGQDIYRSAMRFERLEAPE